MFSKACEYGIRAAVYIAHQSMEGRRVSLKEISEKIDSPMAFTAKILQQLAKNNIVTSVKGAGGGFEMERLTMDQIKLADIVLAMDGDSIFTGCSHGFEERSAVKPCPVHHKVVAIRNDLKRMLEVTSLFAMTTDLEAGLTHLRR